MESSDSASDMEQESGGLRLPNPPIFVSSYQVWNHEHFFYLGPIGSRGVRGLRLPTPPIFVPPVSGVWRVYEV